MYWRNVMIFQGHTGNVFEAALDRLFYPPPSWKIMEKLKTDRLLEEISQNFHKGIIHMCTYYYHPIPIALQ